MIGATGLVGSQAAAQLAGQGDEVHALVRRRAGPDRAGLRMHILAPDQWGACVASIRPEVAVSALGTTLRSAGSREEFRRVDHGLVIGFAAAAREAGARRFILVSSVGADPRARNFYLRVKGEVETAIVGLGFDRVDLIRPGLLRGDRQGPFRIGERVATAAAPLVDRLLFGRLDRFASIASRDVALAIAALAGRAEPGRFVHEGRDLRRLATGRLQIGTGVG